MKSFSFSFDIRGKSFSATAAPKFDDGVIGYQVKAGDLIFTIYATEAADGTVHWADEAGETMELYQRAGEAIERAERGLNG